MEATPTGETSQIDIASEVASALADDTTQQQQQQNNVTSLTQDLPEQVNFVSSDSGSFVRISTSKENVTKPDHGATTSRGEPLSVSNQGANNGGQSSNGVWGWISSAVGGDIVETTQRLGRNIVQKTKDSVDSVITTLDPGMEEYLHKSDSISLVITSIDEDTIEGIKDGFKQVFEHVSVNCQQSRSSLAPLPNSFSSALKSAKQRITNLHSSYPEMENLVVLAVEDFIVEIMPGMWFGMMCLCLHDFSRKLETETFSQAIALPNHVVKKLEEMTPSNYSLRWSGLSVTLTDILHHNWTKFLAEIPKRQVVMLAAKTLAGQYKETVQQSLSVMEQSITL